MRLTLAYSSCVECFEGVDPSKIHHMRLALVSGGALNLWRV